MIELAENELKFSFPQVHPAARLSISFQRTLRIPDDNREYYLPPGLGNFPLRHVDDLGERTPAPWRRRGGVFLPMYQAEALWVRFESQYPFAVKVAAGKINAISGEAWKPEIGNPQDYVVVPEQPWLDGFCVQKNLVRQFVAMPLGAGYTAEEQLSPKAEFGGLQLLVYPLKREFPPPELKCMAQRMVAECADVRYMGLAPGGLMRQEVYRDRYGAGAWETLAPSRCFVHLVNSVQYFALTGEAPPDRPITAEDYTRAGLPWFDYYDTDRAALEGAKTLASMDSVAALGIKRGERPLPENTPVSPRKMVRLSPRVVREGEF